MKKRSLLFCTVLFGIALVAGGMPSLYAQDDDTEEFMLEEVTVTAQKRAENQQKVAISMEVISGEEMAATGKNDVTEILKNISNVQINNSSDGMRVAVRGLVDTESSFHDMHTSSPQVAINIDGAYNSSSSAGQNLFDVERVEVLMGPQSTLYASTSPGGVVNVVTASPKTSKYEASASLEVANFNKIVGQVMVNAPVVSDVLALRLAGEMQKRDSYYDGSDDSDEDSKTVRLKTLYQPSEDLSATVTVSYATKINGGMMGGQVQPFDTEDGYWYYQEEQDGPWIKGGKVTNPWTAKEEVEATGGAMPGSTSNAPAEGPNSSTQDTMGVSAEFSWDTGIGSLLLVPNYSKTESDDQMNYEEDDGTTYLVYTNMEAIQKGVDARLTSDADFFFKWIVGASWFKNTQDRDTSYSNPDETPGTNATLQKNYGFYANVTYPVTDKFRTTVGYRRSWDTSQNIEVPAMQGDGITGQEYSAPDYKLGIEYDLADNSMLYADYSTSYRINALITDQGGKSGEPEELKAYTVGAKNRFLDNRLQANVSAFFYDYQNKSADASDDGRISGTVMESELVSPTGEALDIMGDGFDVDSEVSGMLASDPWIQQFGDFQSMGVDLSMEWLMTSKDLLTFGVSYLTTEWTDLTMEYYWHQLDDDGNVVSFWDDDGKDFGGFENTFSPKWTITAGYQRNMTIGEYGRLVPRMDLTWKDKYFTDYDDVNAIVADQEAYFTVDFSVTYTSPGSTWSVNAYVKNATDYAAKTFFNNDAGYFSLGISEPRMFGVIVSAKF